VYVGRQWEDSDKQISLLVPDKLAVQVSDILTIGYSAGPERGHLQSSNEDYKTRV
jgi:hypothetical protein